MNGRFLLDTNIVFALSVDDDAVLRRLEEEVTVFLSSIVLGELFFGAYGSALIEDNLARATQFAANNTVLVCDTATARHYGRIKNRLREKGRQIPENDIWIAATAQQHGLTLVSRDTHFTAVEGLEAVAW